MYEYLWTLHGEERLSAIEDLPPFATDFIHHKARKNCLRCPVAIRYKGIDGYFHTACTDVISREKAIQLLSKGGEFITHENT